MTTFCIYTIFNASDVSLHVQSKFDLICISQLDTKILLTKIQICYMFIENNFIKNEIEIVNIYREKKTTGVLDIFRFY